MEFQRLDNAAVVDFLTSAASAFAEKGIISAKDTDNLRLVLSGINSAADSRERSLLLELDAQHAEFLDVLTARFGTVGCCLNLIRHTLRSSLAETHKILAELGQALVKKSELLFNRPFYIFRGGRCQKQTLFSTVIIDFSETLARACRLLAETLDELALMNPHDMAAATDADTEVDLALAQALGFRGLISHSLPIHTEDELKRKLSQALSLVADAAAELSEQLAANSGGEAAHDVVAACEWLKAECQRLGLLEFPRSESLMVWEVRRRNLTSCVHSLNEALRQVAKASLASIGQDRVAPTARRTDAVARRLTFDLIAGGTAPAKAREAAHELLRYLDANRLEPREVLVGELNRIHASLQPRTLETLTALASDASLMTLAGPEKKATMARARRLAETFGQALAVLALAVIATGCGLKTRPVSDVVELRPDIPYRGEAPRKPVDAVQPGKETGATQKGAQPNVLVTPAPQPR